MNPTNPASFFHVTSISNSPANGFVINWESVTGRIYSVNRSTNSMNAFTPLETNIAYPRNSYTDTVNQTKNNCFYRLDVRQQ